MLVVRGSSGNRLEIVEPASSTARSISADGLHIPIRASPSITVSPLDTRNCDNSRSSPCSRPEADTASRSTAPSRRRRPDRVDASTSKTPDPARETTPLSPLRISHSAPSDGATSSLPSDTSSRPRRRSSKSADKSHSDDSLPVEVVDSILRRGFPSRIDQRRNPTRSTRTTGTSSRRPAGPDTRERAVTSAPRPQRSTSRLSIESSTPASAACETIHRLTLLSKGDVWTTQARTSPTTPSTATRAPERSQLDLWPPERPIERLSTDGS